MSATDDLLEELLRTKEQRLPCVLVTVASVKGSVPREAGAKMIVYADGRISGTIGGGKFESLVIDAAVRAIGEGTPLLKTYPLHEHDEESFGAICGGEVTVLIEPQPLGPELVLVGAGHCAQSIAKLALDCGFAVTVLDDRRELFEADKFATRVRKITEMPPPEFIAKHQWRAADALVLVSRNYLIDRDSLAAALGCPEVGYLGMIGSRRKVSQVFDELAAAGHSRESFRHVHAPIGLDLGADSPAEIAVSVIAEVLIVLRGASGKSMRLAG